MATTRHAQIFSYAYVGNMHLGRVSPAFSATVRLLCAFKAHGPAIPVLK